jgi:peptidoglycan hydrolase CwlO-like protein
MSHYEDPETGHYRTDCNNCHSLENEINVLQDELESAKIKIDQLEEELHQLQRELTDSYGR